MIFVCHEARVSVFGISVMGTEIAVSVYRASCTKFLKILLNFVFAIPFNFIVRLHDTMNT